MIALHPPSARRRGSNKRPAEEATARDSVGSASDFEDNPTRPGEIRGLDESMQSVAELQSRCVSRLKVVSDREFEVLLHTDTGKQCSTERICELLRQRSDTPLVVAIRYQLGRVVNELLRLGEPLESVKNDETDLPLVAALKTGNDAIIRRLLVDENAPYFYLTDKIPLFLLACSSGNVLQCEILIDRAQANVNLMSELQDADKEIVAEFGRLQTPLHIASRKGHSAVVELLLRHNAAANLQDSDGNTPLHCAGNLETAQVLLSESFKTNPNIPNRRGRTPLHVAAANGDVNVVDFLLHHGAEQDILDDQGQNAFHHAAANGHTAVALVLLHDNEPFNPTPEKAIPNNVNGEPIDGDFNAHENFDGAVEGFDINMADLKGNTALHLAAMCPPEHCQKMLQLLLENGADPNRSNWFGYTPLHLFCAHQSGPASVVDIFIEHGATIHSQSLDGSTALHLAVGRGSEEVAIALVTAGAFVHFSDAAGRSVVDLVESTKQGSMLVPVLRNLSKPPEWLPDDQATECASCHAVFRLAMRKHHCRHCGRIVCYNCSSNKIAIPKFQVQKPARVCDACYDVLAFRKLM